MDSTMVLVAWLGFS